MEMNKQIMKKKYIMNENYETNQVFEQLLSVFFSELQNAINLFPSV